jgi:hypothetical protein
MKFQFILALVLLSSACQSNKKAGSESRNLFQPQFTPGPPAIVYKTKKDYANYVPVELSEDRKSIVSYPSREDILSDSTGSLKPTQLNGFYYLDNRGISARTVFLKMSLEEYAHLDTALSLQSMYGMILDKTPFETMCHCGNKSVFDSIVPQLNAIIAKDSLKQLCKEMKL